MPITAGTPPSGRIIAAHGRHYTVETDTGQYWQAFPSGKRSDYACGDWVRLQPMPPFAAHKARLVAHAPRSTLLFRRDHRKEKLIAANVTQIIIVAATEPAFHDELISRALVAAQTQGLRALILLNKVDLPAQLATARAQLAVFAQAHVPLLELSARDDARVLLPYLHAQISVLVGQSGMGKSTLINALIPDAATPTAEISQALGTGRHTTTYARWYELPEMPRSAIIDSPGLQSFGLAHLNAAALAAAFPEFQSSLAHCRFANCRHDQEPECAIKARVAAGYISPRRYAHYCSILHSLSA